MTVKCQAWKSLVKIVFTRKILAYATGSFSLPVATHVEFRICPKRKQRGSNNEQRAVLVSQVEVQCIEY